MKAPKAVKLPSGAWRCQVMVDGVRFSVTDADAKKAVAKAAALKAKMVEAERGVEKMTVGEAIDRYIDSKDAVLSPATVRGYRKIRACNLQELMGVQLMNLTGEQIQRAVNTMARDHTPKTVRNAHGLLTAMLREYRPAMVVSTTLPQKVKTEITIPTPDQVKMVLDDVAGTDMELPVLLAACMGLRESEICGLRWDDIDFGRGVLTVRRAVVRGIGGPVEKTTKSYAGTRTLTMPRAVVAALETTARSGEAVVTLSGPAIYCRWRKILARLGLPEYRFHDLRHFYASVLMSLGLPDKYAEELMGHATANMLTTVYQHLMEYKREDVKAEVDGFFDRFCTRNCTRENEK